MNTIELLYIDLFCGAGGTSSGVEYANRTWVTELDFPIKPSHWAYVPQKVVNLADCIIKGKESNV